MTLCEYGSNRLVLLYDEKPQVVQQASFWSHTQNKCKFALSNDCDPLLCTQGSPADLEGEPLANVLSSYFRGKTVVRLHVHIGVDLVSGQLKALLLWLTACQCSLPEEVAQSVCQIHQ